MPSQLGSARASEVAGAARWAESLARLVPVPEPHRVEAVDRRGALQMLRCPESTLDWLVEQGLPCALREGEQRFEHLDLFNVGLYSGSGRTLAELVTSYLGRLAAEAPAAWSDARGWRAQVVLTCPRESCGPDAAWEMARPRPAAFGGRLNALTLPAGAEDAERTIRAGGQRGTFAFGVDLVSDGRRRAIASPALRGAYRSVLADHRFQLMAPGLKTDLDWIGRTRASDCDGLSTILAAECERAGHEAHLERGLMLGPFGFGHHTWVRVRDADGDWKVLDPTLPMVAALGASDVEAFSEFCCGSWLNRILPCTVSGQALAGHACGGERATPDVAVRVRRDATQLERR